VADPNLGYPMPNVSPVDDFESFLPRRPNIHSDTPFADPRKENDTPICIHVSPLEPCTPRDITKDVLIFPSPPNPLTLYCKFEEGEIFKGDVSCEKHDAFSDREDHIEEEHLGDYLVKAFEEDKVVFISSTFGLVDSTSLGSIELVHTSCVLSPSNLFVSDHLSKSSHVGIFRV